MHLSAGKQKGLTTLELQAQNIVNENDSDDAELNCNDAERYNELVESRKNRRAVSQQPTSLSCYISSTSDFEFEHKLTFFILLG